jgi:hypothetical protein
MRIRIQQLKLMRIHVDPDLQPCWFLTQYPPKDAWSLTQYSLKLPGILLNTPSSCLVSYSILPQAAWSLSQYSLKLPGLLHDTSSSILVSYSILTQAAKSLIPNTPSSCLVFYLLKLSGLFVAIISGLLLLPQADSF